MARPPDQDPVAADPLDDATWAAIVASHAREGPPDWLDPEEHQPDPEDPDTWSGDFTGAVALAEAEGTDDAGWRETLLEAGIGTGWAHYPGAPAVPGAHGGPGGGFGQGQAHDTAGPEPRLAALADQAAGDDRGFAGVGDDELMGLIGARNRLSSRQVWELLMALAELIRRRPAPYCKPEGPAQMPQVWAEGTSAEVSIQLAITARAATQLLSLAYDLAVKLPRTAAALRDGIFDQDKTQAVASWCEPLNEEQARQAEDLLFTDNPDLATMTWTMVRDRIARAVMSVDPDAARKRRDHGTKDARVETRLELSGNMQIAAREIPPASALAVDQKLTARARELKKAGIKGTMSRLRVLAYLERWGIADPFAHPDSGDGAPDSAGTDGAGPDSAGQDGGDRSADERQECGDGPWPEDWPATDGHDGERREDDGPGECDPGDGDPGDGDPGDCDPGDCDPGDGGNGGTPPDEPDSGGGGGCACGGTPPAGTEDSMAGWLHLTVPAATILEQAARAGQLNKIGPVDADLARSLADKIAKHGQSAICVTVTSPDGRPVAHACGKPARGDPARPTRKRKQDPPGISPPHGTVPPALTPLTPLTLLTLLTPGGPGGYGTWRLNLAGRDLDLNFEKLDGPCEHLHESIGHDPGKLLRHLTAVLNQECTFGTCRTPGHRTDYEHAIPWPQGRTCTCNGHPCCRHNHREKQAPGWHVEGTGQPGWFTWTLPSGRTYPSKPTSYPT